MPIFDLKKYLPKLKRKYSEGNAFLFDPVRSKYVLLQPEELVRQLFIQFLIEEKSYSPKRMQVEKAISVNKMIKRFDLIIYDQFANPRILVEFKKAKSKINQKVFKQISVYNFSLKVDYLVVTNGIVYYPFKMDYVNSSFFELQDIPDSSILYAK